MNINKLISGYKLTAYFYALVSRSNIVRLEYPSILSAKFYITFNSIKNNCKIMWINIAQNMEYY
jgi:hypothetical protein